MSIPIWRRILSSEVAAGKPIRASVMWAGLRNVFAVLGVDPDVDSMPTIPFGIRGEQVFTSSAAWVVPEGIAFVQYDVVGAGGSGADDQFGGNGASGGATSISGSVSGAIVTCNGGAGGVQGGSGGAGGAGGSAPSGGIAGGHGGDAGAAAGVDAPDAPGGGGAAGGGHGSSGAAGGGPWGSGGRYGTAPTGYGNGGSGDKHTSGSQHGGGGGGGARKTGVVAVQPGETLTITVGAGGIAPSGGAQNGRPGLVVIRY